MFSGASNSSDDNSPSRVNGQENGGVPRASTMILSGTHPPIFARADLAAFCQAFVRSQQAVVITTRETSRSQGVSLVDRSRAPELRRDLLDTAFAIIEPDAHRIAQVSTLSVTSLIVLPSTSSIAFSLVARTTTQKQHPVKCESKWIIKPTYLPFISWTPEPTSRCYRHRADGEWACPHRDGSGE